MLLTPCPRLPWLHSPTGVPDCLLPAHLDSFSSSCPFCIYLASSPKCFKLHVQLVILLAIQTQVVQKYFHCLPHLHPRCPPESPTSANPSTMLQDIQGQKLQDIGFSLFLLCWPSAAKFPQSFPKPCPSLGFPGGSGVKNPPATQKAQEKQLQSLGWEDPLEEEMAANFSILAWRTPQTE